MDLLIRNSLLHKYNMHILDKSVDDILSVEFNHIYYYTFLTLLPRNYDVINCLSAELINFSTKKSN